MPAEEINPSAITANLATSLIGRKVLYYPSLVSTMETGRQAAAGGTEEGTVIVAGEQTGGRGRLGRVWKTPPGNIALSVILYPEAAALPYLVMMASLAMVRAVKAVTGLEASIKWPNDVLVGGRKICGILTESIIRGGKVGYAVIGIGINVDINIAEYPDIAATATSLNVEAGKTVSRLDLIRELLTGLDGLYLSLGDGESIFRDWRGKLATLGRRVCVTDGNGSIEGVAEDVSRSGALLLRRDDGSLMEVVASDVSLR